jgi:hypothetical protein
MLFKILIKGTRYRRYRPAEYSDRVINLNKLEDRNLDNKLKRIERENRIGMNILLKDIKKLESELEFRKEALNIIRNKDKLKKLSSTLSDNLLNSENPRGHTNDDIDSGYEYLFKYSSEIAHSNMNHHHHKPHTSLSTYNHDVDNDDIDEEDRTNIVNNRKNLSAHGRLTNHYKQDIPGDSSENKLHEPVRVKSAYSVHNTSSISRSDLPNNNNNNDNNNNRPSMQYSRTNSDLNMKNKTPERLSRNSTKLSFELKREKTDENNNNVYNSETKTRSTTSSRLSINKSTTTPSIPSKQTSPKVIVPVPVVIAAVVDKNKIKTDRIATQIQSKPVIINKNTDKLTTAVLITHQPSFNQQRVQRSRIIPTVKETRLSRNRTPKPNINDVEPTTITKYVPLRITNLQIDSDFNSLIMPNKMEKTSLPQLILKAKKI